MLIGQVRFLSVAIALSQRSGCLDEVLLHRLGQSSLLVLLEGIDGNGCQDTDVLNWIRSELSLQEYHYVHCFATLL